MTEFTEIEYRFKGDKETESLWGTVCSTNSCPEDVYEDTIFYYGLSREDIITAKENKTLVSGEFYILDYE